MSEKKKIQTLIQEAKIYRTQGLLEESRAKYISAGRLIQKNENLIANNKKLLAGIAKNVREIKAEIDKLDNAPTTLVMPKKVQDIIKEKFAFAEDENAGALEGAIALAKFGQFERALEEFDTLIDRKPIRLEAAKNIIRCHKVLETVEVAVERYQNWLSGKLFTVEQLNKLRIFLQDILDKRGMDIDLPKKTADEETPEPDISEPLIEMPPEAETELEMPVEASDAPETDTGIPMPDADVEEDGIPMPETEEPESEGIPMPETDEPESDGIPMPETEEPESEGIPMPETDEPESDGIPMPEEAVLELESAEEGIPMPEEAEAEPEMGIEEEDDYDDDEDFDAIPEEDILDISSVEIVLNKGPRKGDTVELDVCFQSGNVINLLISGDEHDLIDALQEGTKMKNLRFYSPIAMFQGKGVVSSSTKLESGPKQGDYSLDIQIRTITG